MLGHKTNLSKFKKTDTHAKYCSSHSGMKLEINNRRKVGKFTNMWKLNNTPKEGQRRNKIFLEINENGNNILKLIICS